MTRDALCGPTLERILVGRSEIGSIACRRLVVSAVLVGLVSDIEVCVGDSRIGGGRLIVSVWAFGHDGPTVSPSEA